MSVEALAWALDASACPQKMSAAQRLVLIQYAEHHNAKRDDSAYPGTDRLVRRTGLARSTVIAAVDWLVEHRFLEVGDQRWAEHLRKGARPTVYRLRGFITYRSGNRTPSSEPVRSPKVTRPIPGSNPVRSSDPNQELEPVRETPTPTPSPAPTNVVRLRSADQHAAAAPGPGEEQAWRDATRNAAPDLTFSEALAGIEDVPEATRAALAAYLPPWVLPGTPTYVRGVYAAHKGLHVSVPVMGRDYINTPLPLQLTREA